MQLWIDLHVLITIVTLISSGNLPGTDASINTVEEFLDTLINSSRYDRRIRPFVEQKSEFAACDFPPPSLSLSIHYHSVRLQNRAM